MNILDTIAVAAATAPEVTDPATLAKLREHLERFRSSCLFFDFPHLEVETQVPFAADTAFILTRGEKGKTLDLPHSGEIELHRVDASRKETRVVSQNPGRETFLLKGLEVRVQSRIPRGLPKKVDFPEVLEGQITEDLGYRFARLFESHVLTALIQFLIQTDRVVDAKPEEVESTIIKLAGETQGLSTILTSRRDALAFFRKRPRDEVQVTATSSVKATDCLADGVLLVAANEPHRVGFARGSANPETYAFVQPNDVGHVTCATVGHYGFCVWGDAPVRGVRVTR